MNKVIVGENKFPNLLIKNIPAKAPIIIIPSRAILTTPLLSENIPPKATSKRGIENNIVC